jgi:hypothetical protein
MLKEGREVKLGMIKERKIITPSECIIKTYTQQQQQQHIIPDVRAEQNAKNNKNNNDGKRSNNKNEMMYKE